MQQLRSEGWVSAVFVLLAGPGGAQGSSVVDEFGSPAGARGFWASKIKVNAGFASTLSSAGHQIPGGVKPLRVKLSGVPSAEGYAALIPGPGPGGRVTYEYVVNVAWIEGRCALLLGNTGLGMAPLKPYVERVRAAVLAIYQRTRGECP